MSVIYHNRSFAQSWSRPLWWFFNKFGKTPLYLFGPITELGSALWWLVYFFSSFGNLLRSWSSLLAINLSMLFSTPKSRIWTISVKRFCKCWIAAYWIVSLFSIQIPSTFLILCTKTFLLLCLIVLKKYLIHDSPSYFHWMLACWRKLSRMFVYLIYSALNLLNSSLFWSYSSSSIFCSISVTSSSYFFTFSNM